jgi:CheY-like chemotaxis protein
VLVVDDDHDVRVAVCEVLEANGFAVDLATDGAEGLERFERDRPRVVIADLEMPRLRGVDLLRRVREIDAGATVVLMTGYATLDLAIQAMKDGATDFLVKPIRVGRLLASIGFVPPGAAPAPATAARSDLVPIAPGRGWCWRGSAAPGRGFAGSVSERSGSIVLYAGEVLDGGRDAPLAAVLADDALSGLAERVGSPDRVLLLAGQAVTVALELSPREIAAAMARIAPGGKAITVAAAGTAVYLASERETRPLVAAGRSLRLATDDREVTYPVEAVTAEPGSLLVLASPALVRAFGPEGCFEAWLGRVAGGGVAALGTALAGFAATSDEVALAMAPGGLAIVAV